MIDLFGAIKFKNPELDAPAPAGYFVINRHCLVRLVRDNDGVLRWHWLRWCSPVEWENAEFKMTRIVKYRPISGLMKFEEGDLDLKDNSDEA